VTVFEDRELAERSVNAVQKVVDHVDDDEASVEGRHKVGSTIHAEQIQVPSKGHKV